MSNAVYSNAAMVTAFLATMAKTSEAWSGGLALVMARSRSSIFSAAIAAGCTLALILLALVPQLVALSAFERQLILGTLLLIIGMRWLRKAILSYIGTLPKCSTRTASPDTKTTQASSGFDWLDFAFAFRVAFINAFQIVCIVVALAYAGDALNAACSGVIYATALLAITGMLLQRPLSQIPYNRLVFSVGAILCAFGTFWTAEGLGFIWPEPTFAVLVMALTFWATGWVAVIRGGFGDQKYATIIPFKNSIP